MKPLLRLCACWLALILVASGARAAPFPARPFEAILTLARPADTTAYAVGQVFATAASGLTGFPALALGIGPQAPYVVTNVTLISSNGGAASKGNFDIYLFAVAAPAGGGYNDHAAFAATAAALGAPGNALIGLASQMFANSGSAAYGYAQGGLSWRGATDGAGNIYPAIVLNNAYTPASGETLTLKITGLY